MTIEQLERANKIYAELKEKKEFLKAFKSPLSNSIQACDCSDYSGRDTTKILLLEKDKNLSDFISRYISGQIAALEKQLEEL